MKSKTYSPRARCPCQDLDEPISYKVSQSRPRSKMAQNSESLNHMCSRSDTDEMDGNEASRTQASMSGDYDKVTVAGGMFTCASDDPHWIELDIPGLPIHYTYTTVDMSHSSQQTTSNISQSFRQTEGNMSNSFRNTKTNISHNFYQIEMDKARKSDVTETDKSHSSQPIETGMEADEQHAPGVSLSKIAWNDVTGENMTKMSSAPPRAECMWGESFQGAGMADGQLRQVVSDGGRGPWVTAANTTRTPPRVRRTRRTWQTWLLRSGGQVRGDDERGIYEENERTRCFGSSMRRRRD